MNLYRLSIVLCSNPDYELHSGITAKVGSLKTFAHRLAGQGHSVQVQVMDINHRVQCNLALGDVHWGAWA